MAKTLHNAFPCSPTAAMEEKSRAADIVYAKVRVVKNEPLFEYGT
jgi:hypothetical protein